MVRLSEPPIDMQRRRSERLAAIDAANNNVSEGSSASSVEENGGHPISGYGGVAKKQMKSKNMEKNKIEKRKGGEDYVQFRCNMMSFFNTMQRVKKHITERHLELLQQTPFWPLISAFYSGVILEDQCKKSDNDVRTIIKCYNSRTMSFEFGSTSASLTTKDIAEILGLPKEGEEVQLKGTQKHISDFTKRYFEEETILYKKLVDNALEKALKGKRETDVGDVVRLIVLELCGTFLFCTTSHTIFWNLVKYCEDLEKISRYSWAKAVADVLHEALGKQTRGCKPCSIPGCVVVIMLWLCEKTNLIQPINGREGHKPALVKWRVRELHSKLNEIDVTDIGLSFKKDKKKKKNKNDEMEKPLEEAKIDGQDLEEGENVLDDTAASLECAFRAQKTQPKLLSVRTMSKRLIDKENLEKRREDLGEMIQNASAEVAKAQGKVNRLTEKLESDKIKNLKRKLKEEKEEKRKMKEDYEFLIAEQKSLLESVKRFVKNLEGALKAELEEVKNLKKDKMEMIKEIQELKDQLNEGSPCAALQDIQIEVCQKQLFFTSLDKNRVKRASDPEFEYEQEGKKKRKVGE